MKERITVTITRQDSIVTKSDDDGHFSDVLAEAILADAGRRICFDLADTVENLARYRGTFEHIVEYWPGYVEAVGNFCEAASALVKGWSEHDKKIMGGH